MPAELEAYAAPPAYRPMSAGAVTAFVLAIVLTIPAYAIGLWWTEVLPLLVAALSWGGMSSGARRGTGLAITASLNAFGVGALGCISHRELKAVAEKGFAPFADALAADDRATLAKWAVESEDAATRMDLWKRRIDAAKASSGQYRHELQLPGSIWSGSLVALARPPGVEEVEPKGDKALETLDAWWMRATFEKGEVWIALVGRVDDDHPKGGLSAFQVLEGAGATGRVDSPHGIADVRVFRAKP